MLTRPDKNVSYLCLYLVLLKPFFNEIQFPNSIKSSTWIRSKHKHFSWYQQRTVKSSVKAFRTFLLHSKYPFSLFFRQFWFSSNLKSLFHKVHSTEKFVGSRRPKNYRHKYSIPIFTRYFQLSKRNELKKLSNLRSLRFWDELCEVWFFHA